MVVYNILEDIVACIVAVYSELVKVAVEHTVQFAYGLGEVIILLYPVVLVEKVLIRGT